MNKRKWRVVPSRLGVQILLFFLIAAAVAAGLYFSMAYFSNSYISSHFNNSKAVQNQIKQEIDNFQNYINANDLSSSDTKEINNWILNDKYVLMHIYKNNNLVDSYPNYVKNQYKLKPAEEFSFYHHLFNVTFTDGTAQVEIYLLAASKYYNVAQVVELLIAFACFIVIFLILISSKFKYINLLQKELKIIEGGDLDYPVTIKGNDEISLLASGIDEMRKSFAERIKSENEAKRANSELITSISHDLRTPLTILIGDLDVIADKKYKSEELLNHYIENSRKKAYQLKELSDKLFEYFFVFGSEYQEPDIKPTDCSAMIKGLISEYSLYLEDHGFTVNVAGDIPDCMMEADVIGIRRVFDNLFSNVLKYASTAVPVAVDIKYEDGFLYVSIENAVGKEPSKAKSTNIGLSTCKKIMAQHGGTITVAQTDEDYKITTGFPVKIV